MIYHFKRDGSGEAIAECLHEDLDPYPGRYYPASDIPARARRLYGFNPLRLIRDSHGAPIAVIEADPDTPLDMTYCVLRSVSPIHIEYLHNMGVAASMSISIVISDSVQGADQFCPDRHQRR